jgi:hypothetical protein
MNEYCQRRMPLSALAHHEFDPNTHLCEIGSHTAHKVDVHQVWLCPERSQSRSLERLPPLEKRVKALATVARVNLDLKLANG